MFYVTILWKTKVGSLPNFERHTDVIQFWVAMRGRVSDALWKLLREAEFNPGVSANLEQAESYLENISQISHLEFLQNPFSIFRLCLKSDTKQVVYMKAYIGISIIIDYVFCESRQEKSFKIGSIFSGFLNYSQI